MNANDAADMVSGFKAAIDHGVASCGPKLLKRQNISGACTNFSTESVHDP